MTLCKLCEKPIEFKPDDDRAAVEGSWVDEDGDFCCEDGDLHQG